MFRLSQFLQKSFPFSAESHNVFRCFFAFFSLQTDGGARKDEEAKGPDLGFPHMYDCGKGIVYSFAASSDGKSAIDAAQADGTSAIDAAQAKLPLPCGNDGSISNQKGGAMTTAFASSVLASGAGSILQGVEHIRGEIRNNNEFWLRRKELFLEAQRNGTMSMSERFPAIDQIPNFASSHFCRIDERPLFL